jgi:hypothetical protein
VAISDGAATTNGDKVKMRFKIASTGERARLKISGIVHLEGAIRPFSALYIFKSTGIVAISNLAPAIDDGHAAEGTYTVFPRKITAETPFTFGTTAGKGTIQLRLKKRPRGLQLLVVQALSSNALVKPISWKFAAVSRR